MIGAGPTVFAIMGYVIARTKKSRVELNPKLLAAILGCDEHEVREAIEYLASPDENSRNKEHQGRRLVKEGAYQYFVPSWEHYRGIRNEDDRREYNRIKQRERRARLKGAAVSNNGLPGEATAVRVADATDGAIRLPHEFQ